MFSVILAAALLMTDPTPAPAAPAAAAPTPAPAAPAVAVAAPADATKAPAAKLAKGEKVDRDGRVCHYEQVLGTRFPEKVCYSPAEEEARRQDDHANLNRMQSQFGIVAH